MARGKHTYNYHGLLAQADLFGLQYLGPTEVGEDGLGEGFLFGILHHTPILPDPFLQGVVALLDDIATRLDLLVFGLNLLEQVGDLRRQVGNCERIAYQYRHQHQYQHRHRHRRGQRLTPAAAAAAAPAPAPAERQRTVVAKLIEHRRRIVDSRHVVPAVKLNSVLLYSYSYSCSFSRLFLIVYEQEQGRHD